MRPKRHLECASECLGTYPPAKYCSGRDAVLAGPNLSIAPFTVDKVAIDLQPSCEPHVSVSPSQSASTR